MQRFNVIVTLLLFTYIFSVVTAHGTGSLQDSIYEPGPLKPIDSGLKVNIGDPAPYFSLPSLNGKRETLNNYLGTNVVLSFIPAAWTPVCSDQWPGYNISENIFKEHDAVLFGISVDNIPTLHAWTRLMGRLWFNVLSDFWPHGAVADAYGILRSDGTAERALVFIDKKGIIKGIHVSDINVRPPLELIVDELKKLDNQ